MAVMGRTEGAPAAAATRERPAAMAERERGAPGRRRGVAAAAERDAVVPCAPVPLSRSLTMEPEKMRWAWAQ